MTIRFTHPALIGSAGALVVLAAASIVRPLPWPIWAVWGALTLVGTWRASRDR